MTQSYQPPFQEKKGYTVTLNDCQKTARSLLPRLATLCWARRQAVLQKSVAAGAEEKRWELVIIVLDEDIKNQERLINRQMSTLKFKAKGLFS